MRSTFKLLFYVNRQKIKANGCTLIMGRVTLDGKVCQYSTGIEIAPDSWNAEKGRVKSDRNVNHKLDELEMLAKLTYKKSIDSIGYVSAEIIKNAVTGKSQSKDTLLSLFDEHNEEFAKRVEIDRGRHCSKRYQTARRHVENFLKYKYGVEDMPLVSLDMRVIADFHFYLSTILTLAVGTLNNYLISLRKIARLAVKQHTLKRDPFAGYKMDVAPSKHRYLTSEQFSKILSVELPTYRLCHTRDLFVFSTFTGIGRADLANLKEENIITKEDGSKWVHIARQKTKSECHIKLLDIPLQIIEKYKGEGKGDRLFFVPDTPSLGNSLKMIAKQCGLDCNLTYYQSRHSFATLICMNNGVPIETISKMMGHRSIRTTQIYAEVSNQKIGKDMGYLADSLRERYTLPQENILPQISLRKRRNILDNNIQKENKL